MQSCISQRAMTWGDFIHRNVGLCANLCLYWLGTAVQLVTPWCQPGAGFECDQVKQEATVTD
jgi:hypothetical protein